MGWLTLQPSTHYCSTGKQSCISSLDFWHPGQGGGRAAECLIQCFPFQILVVQLSYDTGAERGVIPSQHIQD